MIIKAGKLLVKFEMSANVLKPIKKNIPDTVLITVVMRLDSKFMPIANSKVTKENNKAEPVVT